MTFAHYDFEQGSSIHEHSHAQEEVWEIIEGEVEFVAGGAVRVLRPGMAAVVGPNVPHSVTAITDGRAIVVDYPRRADP
jgi:quercetin dioxygenase-like cupin family protein